MVLRKRKACLEETCNKQPNFNFVGEKTGLYCSEHKKDDMINVIDKTCLVETCNKRPNFNFSDKMIGLYCSTHRFPDMVDVLSKRCLADNCDKIPSFNFKSEKALYCAAHKKDGMINVKNKTCLEDNCDKRPNYNLPGEKIGLYCNEHKKDGMVNVKDKTCLEEICDKQPSFNLPGKKIALYCAEHKKDYMIDVKNKKCILCVDTRADKKYKNYCIRCFMFTFPDEKVSRNYKIKEKHMTDFIKENFPDETMIFDKQIGGCSKRRPDCYIDKFTHVIVVECDENQHNGYEDICDNKRTMELFQDFGSRPMVFIRFNPDKYIDSNNKKIMSSFKVLKATGISVIRDEKEWNKRLDVLKNCLEKWLIIVPEKEITNEFLFYDTIDDLANKLNLLQI